MIVEEAWNMNFAALRYEELALNAFPVLHTEVYDGWILRFSEGKGYQGNCISPLYLSTKSYEDKINYCENKFEEKRASLCIQNDSQCPVRTGSAAGYESVRTGG